MKSAVVGTIDRAAVEALKEKYYRRNYIALVFEGFFFSFGYAMFSHQTVLPIYVSNITESTVLVSLLTLIFFSLSNGSSIFSAVLGVNTTSPKWLSVFICALQRLGFLLIFLSTYTVAGSPELGLVLFFSSYAVFAVTAGLSSPMFATMVSSVIHRDVPGFYGSYALAGAVGGLVASRVIAVFERYPFPEGFRYMFLSGLIMAVLATLIVVFFVREVRREPVAQKLRFADLPGLFKTVVRDNRPFRNFLVARVLVAAAELSVPFYIVKVSTLEGVTEGFVGAMSTVLLVSSMVFGKVLGYVGRRWGPFAQLGVGCAAGIGAALLAIALPSPSYAYLLFALVSLAGQGPLLANSVATIVYAPPRHVSVYASFSGLIVAPFYGLFSLGGGLVANIASLDSVFMISLALYAAALVFVLSLRRRNATYGRAVPGS